MDIVGRIIAGATGLLVLCLAVLYAGVFADTDIAEMAEPLRTWVTLAIICVNVLIAAGLIYVAWLGVSGWLRGRQISR